MAQLFVVTSRQHAITDWGMTPYSAIAGALRGVTLPRDPPVQWVGAPRVVRRAVIGSGFDTYVTAVLSWPDPPPGGRRQSAGDLQRVFGPRIRDALNAAGSGWDPIAIVPYLDANQGSDLNWWASGQAAQTRTRDAYPTLGGRVDLPENPYGPDSAAVRPSTAAEAARQIAQQAGATVGAGVGAAARGAASGIGLLLGVAAVAAGGIYLAQRYAGKKAAGTLGKLMNPFSSDYARKATRNPGRMFGMNPSRALPGSTGEGDYYHVQVRPRAEFVRFRTQDVGGPGGIERVAGRTAKGSWLTQKWLIAKTDAHVEHGRLVGHTPESRALLAHLGSAPFPIGADRFIARDRPNVPEYAKPTPAQREARMENLRKAQAARREMYGNPSPLNTPRK